MDIKINHDDWECYGCKTLNNKEFLQVDAIEDDKMLLSNYYEQRYVKSFNIPPLNAPYCLPCIDKLPGLKNKFEAERTEDYLFKQNGYTCRNAEKQQSFKRNCGECVGCQKPLILNSLFEEHQTFYILWSPHLLSRGFPAPSTTQVFKLINACQFYIETTKPLFLCEGCYKQEEWSPCHGPIVCPLCDMHFPRWIFHWATKPVKDGSGCYCHVNIYDKETIMDGYVSPEEFEWIGEKPEKFKDNKPFCYQCLNKLVTDGLLSSLWESCSTEEEIIRTPEERERIKAIIFPGYKMNHK